MEELGRVGERGADDGWGVAPQPGEIAEEGDCEGGPAGVGWGDERESDGVGGDF